MSQHNSPNSVAFQIEGFASSLLSLMSKIECTGKAQIHEANTNFPSLFSSDLPLFPASPFTRFQNRLMENGWAKQFARR